MSSKIREQRSQWWLHKRKWRHTSLWKKIFSKREAVITQFVSRKQQHSTPNHYGKTNHIIASVFLGQKSREPLFQILFVGSFILLISSSTSIYFDKGCICVKSPIENVNINTSKVSFKRHLNLIHSEMLNKSILLLLVKNYHEKSIYVQKIQVTILLRKWCLLCGLYPIS